MQRNCKQCGSDFEITNDDLAFYDKVSPVFAGKKESIPPPTLCPDCRLQRRLAFRNQIHVYSRQDSNTGQPIFSTFTPDAPFPVIARDEWWLDNWDPLSYGRSFDPSRSVFAQIDDLHHSVPHPSLTMTQVENSDYCNNASYLKSCYFVFESAEGQDCFYCEASWHIQDCIDCSNVHSSTLCYDCVDCLRGYNLQSSEFCEDCTDSLFLSHCRSCKSCFGCVNLRHQEYCFFNEQLTKEEYERRVAALNLGSHSGRSEAARRCREFFLQHPRPHARISKVENVTGNSISESKDIFDSFFVTRSENLRNCFQISDGAHDCRDYSHFGLNAELMYECSVCGVDTRNLAFCHYCVDSCTNMQYCLFGFGGSDCFGCVCLKKKRYCIFNKQYTKDEYDRLVPKIIEKMRADGEWGELLPMTYSPFPYNETLAQRYFPLTKEKVTEQSLWWYEDASLRGADAIESASLPNELPPTDDPIIVKSEQSGRPFKITSQEIKRYRQFNVPLPRTTYDERMETRAAKLGGIKLYDRTCAKTGKPILTTYPPDSPYIIWDRDVYEQEFGG